MSNKMEMNSIWNQWQEDNVRQNQCSSGMHIQFISYPTFINPKASNLLISPAVFLAHRYKMAKIKPRLHPLKMNTKQLTFLLFPKCVPLVCIHFLRSFDIILICVFCIFWVCWLSDTTICIYNFILGYYWVSDTTTCIYIFILGYITQSLQTFPFT